MIEPISETESVTAVFDAAHIQEPPLFVRDGDQRFPFRLSVSQYLAQAWLHRGRYGWQRAVATGNEAAFAPSRPP